jgi:site-specific recombinase XerD
MLLTTAIDEVLAQSRAEGIADRTLVDYRKRLRRLVGFLHHRGAVQVADVVAVDLDAWCQDLVDQGLKRGTRVSYAATVRLWFRRCHERGWILRDPALDLAVPEDFGEELPPPPLSEAQVDAVLTNLPRATITDLGVCVLLELFYSCALRLGESLALDVGDLDFPNRRIIIRHGKGDREGEVPLLPKTMALVKDYLAVRRELLASPDHGALFLDRKGRRLTEQGVRDLFLRLNRDRPAGVPHFHPHLFRHSLAVHFLRGGADIRHVQAFLRHCSIETTRVYLRMVTGHLREDYDKAMPKIAVKLKV